MNKFIKQAAAILAACVLATPAFAAQETFDLTWSGASFGNGASATGWVTIDTDAFTTGYNAIYLPDASVTALSITVTGANVGNGTYGLSDFGIVTVQAPFPLDFTSQLIGQQSGGVVFGADGTGMSDFNFVAKTDTTPTSQSYFVLISSGLTSVCNGSFIGDSMLMTSMIAGVPLTPSASAVPEPASITMMLAGFGLVGFAARRRKSRD